MGNANNKPSQKYQEFFDENYRERASEVRDSMEEPLIEKRPPSPLSPLTMYHTTCLTLSEAGMLSLTKSELRKSLSYLGRE